MQILEIPKKGRKDFVNFIVKKLKDGCVFVIPTDTVYGFVAKADDKKSVEKIFKIKKRPKSKPLALFVSSIGQAKKIAEIDREKEIILRRYWPGKFTFLLREKNSHVDNNCLSKGRIGIRIPKNKLILQILKEIKMPLAQTSANISGLSESFEINKALSQFNKKKVLPDFVISGGNLPKSKASKVIDLTGKKVKILRK